LFQNNGCEPHWGLHITDNVFHVS